jgi:hypothetical protein
MHKTSNLDDGYMGSGKLIKAAIAKHGVQNFLKEILHVFDNEEDMKCKEKELIVLNEMSYNLCEGGRGGWDYINKNGLSLAYSNSEEARQNALLGSQKFARMMKDDAEYRRRQSEIRRNSHCSKKEDYVHLFLGKKHSEEAKHKMSLANSKMTGSKNSQFGSFWITNGSENKKIKEESPGRKSINKQKNKINT